MHDEKKLRVGCCVASHDSLLGHQSFVGGIRESPSRMPGLRMTPAEKKTTQEEWKKEWERIQAEQRAKAAAAEAKAAKQAAQQPSA